MVGSNLPPGANRDPRAPYNRGPPMIEERAADVNVGVSFEVPENASDDRVRREIKKAINRGDFDLLHIDHQEVIDRRQG